jgi:hypothetical protein
MIFSFSQNLFSKIMVSSLKGEYYNIICSSLYLTQSRSFTFFITIRKNNQLFYIICTIRYYSDIPFFYMKDMYPLVRGMMYHNMGELLPKPKKLVNEKNIS